MRKRDIMKKCKLWIITLILSFLTCSTSIITVYAKNLKTEKKEIVVMEGATRLLMNAPNRVTYKINDKRTATVLKDKIASFSTVAWRSDEYEYGLLLKGKKAGKTTITVTTSSKKYIYTVTVISKKSVQDASKKALTKHANTLKNTKQCAYMDFNGDGIKELYHDGNFSYYNYVLKKVVTKPYISDKSITQVSSLLVDTKSHIMFAIPKEERFIGDPDPNYAMYSGYIYGSFAFFNEEKVFDILSKHVHFLRYQQPEEFLGDRYEEGTDYYCLEVPSYDQDDYWYEAYTKEEMDQKLDEFLPNAVQVKFTKKPVIK